MPIHEYSWFQKFSPEGPPELKKKRRVLRTMDAFPLHLHLLCAAACRKRLQRRPKTSGDDRKAGGAHILGHLKFQHFISGLKRVDVNFDLWYHFWVGFIIIWNGNSWQDACHWGFKCRFNRNTRISPNTRNCGNSSPEGHQRWRKRGECFAPLEDLHLLCAAARRNVWKNIPGSSEIVRNHGNHNFWDT